MKSVSGKSASKESDVSTGRELTMELDTELETEVRTKSRSTLGAEVCEKTLVVSGIMTRVTKVSIPELEEALP